MQDEFDDALQIALKKLKASDRFESEVRAALSGHADAVIDRVVHHLRDRGILDDRRTAEQVMRKYGGARSLGRAALAERLQHAPREVAEEVLPASEDERLRLWELLVRRYRPTDPPMKAARFLASRGFSEDDIESAVERYFGEASE